MFGFLQPIIVRLYKVFGGTTSNAESDSKPEETIQYLDDKLLDYHYYMDLNELEHLVSF